MAPRIVELMSHPSEAIQVPALRVAGNLVTGDDLQTEAVIQAGLLPHLALKLGDNNSLPTMVMTYHLDRNCRP
jgi:hypothetical protein